MDLALYLKALILGANTRRHIARGWLKGVGGGKVGGAQRIGHSDVAGEGRQQEEAGSRDSKGDCRRTDMREIEYD